MSIALYPARIWREDGVFYVQFLDLENGFTFGDTLEEAKTMAADVLSALLESALQHNEDTPEPSAEMAPSQTCEHKGGDIYSIAPGPKVQQALLLRKVRGQRSQNEMASAIGITLERYRQFEEASAGASLIILQKAFKESGKELVIEAR